MCGAIRADVWDLLSAGFSRYTESAASHPTAPWDRGSMVLGYHGIGVPGHHGGGVAWCWGIMVLGCRCRRMVPGDIMVAGYHVAAPHPPASPAESHRRFPSSSAGVSHSTTVRGAPRTPALLLVLVPTPILTRVLIRVLVLLLFSP